MEIKQTGYESSLTLEKLFFEEFTFKRTDDIDYDSKLEMSVNREVEALPDNLYKITVILGIFDEKKENLNISIKTIGIFKLNTKNFLEEDFKQTIVNKNSLSIMFPYIRSQLSLITTQPDLQPIILPVFNINSLVENQ